MAWCLDLRSLEEPELLEEFFLLAGKALYLATNYEAKCRHLLRQMRLTERVAQGGNANETEDVADLLRAKLLGPTIAEMKGFPDFSAIEVAKLERAKKARNYIVHEATDVGAPLSSVRASHIQDRFERLREELDCLVEGDNIVSNWIFGIENWKDRFRGIRDIYPVLVRKWLYGSGSPVGEEG